MVLCGALTALPAFARSANAGCDAPSIAALAAVDVFGGGVNVAPVDGVARGSSCPEDDSSAALTLLVREGRNLRPLLQHNLSQWQLLKDDVCSTATGRMVSEHAKWNPSAADYARAGDADIVLSANSVTITMDPGADSTVEQTRRARRVVHDSGKRYAPVAGSDGWWSFGN
ncbi:hypothetical protein JM951_11050 [Xanthomonas fragariae]|nr:hypothetical protein BER92_11985 [Xanthomonas fragariae]ENZ97042.1 hypothetical protein O1K_01402 [Xanthomonas fragariae LMG 25863]MBL9196386.1 hypothetical protein [Xanthomonas fragariae]MBL9221723.1 hypothetical protein [Xanthomonas fragariae]